MVKVELIKNCIYHAPSHVFDYRNDHTKIQEVDNKLAKVLLGSGYFKEVEEAPGNDSEENQNPVNATEVKPGK